MAELTTDRVFDRILKECKREAEKVVKEEITELRVENKRLQKERDNAVKIAMADAKDEIKGLERDLIDAQKEAQYAEKNGAFFEEQVCYWFDDEDGLYWTWELIDGACKGYLSISARTQRRCPTAPYLWANQQLERKVTR